MKFEIAVKLKIMNSKFAFVLSVALFSLTSLLAQVPTNGLIAYYPFSGNANDVSGNGYNGTVHGATLTTDRFGNSNSAYSFNGIDNWINTSYVENTLSGFSVSVWVKTSLNLIGPGTSPSCYAIISNRGPSLSGGKSITLDYDVCCGGNWNWGLDADYKRLGKALPYVNTNTWTHIVGVWQGAGASGSPGQFSLYMNGVLQSNANSNTNGSFDIPFSAPSETLKIGKSEAWSSCFSGSIDDLSIYNRALNTTEITALYQVTSPVDLTIGLMAYYPFRNNANDESGNGYNGTVHGATLTTDRFGNTNSAYSFNGASDWINTSYQQTNLSQFSVSAWVKTDMNSGNNSYVVIQNRGPNVPGGMSMTLDYWKDGGKWRFGADGYGVGIYQATNWTNSNEWMQITGVWQSSGSSVAASQMKLFINGVQVSNYAANIGSASVPITGTGTLKIAFHEAFNTYFKGSIDDIRVYERALNDNEVLALYQVEAPPLVATTGLIAYYPFNGNANDETGNGHNGSVSNATLTSDIQGNVNKAYNFNGTNSTINLGPNFNFNNSFSVSFYAKTTVNPGTNPTLFSQGLPNENQGLHLMLGVNYFRFSFYGTSNLDCTTSFPPLNTWAYWTFTFDNTTRTRKTYLNGNFLCNDVAPSNCQSAGDVILGRVAYNITNTAYYNGTIDELRIYNRPLSGTEVSQLYSGSSAVVSFPIITLSSATLNSGQSLIISGDNFSPNNSAHLLITSSLGSEVVNSNVSVNSSGVFQHTLPIDNTFLGGEYRIEVSDNIKTVIIQPKKFLVSKIIDIKMAISQPTATYAQSINQNIEVVWRDFVRKGTTFGFTALPNKHYKIEVSPDNGSTWQTVSENVQKVVILESDNFFTFSFKINAVGTYVIKITDRKNPANFCLSEAFEVITPNTTNFQASLLWDKSCPVPESATSKEPKGLAADGTSRVLIKLSKNAANLGNVTSIVATILPQSTSFSGTAMLGKIMPAVNYGFYSEEANVANQTSATLVSNASVNEFYFWLVAPDDFTQELNNQQSERAIKVIFQINYSNASSENFIKDNILIIRPPLMFVHGLNSGPDAFKNCRYNVDGTAKYFDNDESVQNFTWKHIKRIKLDGGGSFDRNAKLLLQQTTPFYELQNTFSWQLNEMHKRGYACNRVDYVGHSMGGCIARAVINNNSTDYKPSVNSGAAYKNYSKGFINKLITVNTPHNGSPVADLVWNYFPRSVGLTFPIWTIKSLTSSVDGIFTPDGIIYRPSDAIKDLRSYDGGVRFSETFVKNHLIGGSVSNAVFTGTPISLVEGFLTLYTSLIPKSRLPFQSNIDLVNQFIHSTAGVSDFLNNSDIIVGSSSQFPSLNLANIPDVDLSPNANTPATNSFGWKRWHVGVTDDLAIGTKIMHLLNSPINSSNFSNSIAANPATNGSAYYRFQNTLSVDTVISYVDTGYTKIITPVSNYSFYVDSNLTVTLGVKDTVNLQKIQLFVQGQLYESYSKEAIQNFQMKASSIPFGKSTIVSKAMYDSSGSTIYHIDTVSINVRTADTLNGYYISPHSQILNSHQIIDIEHNAVFKHFIAGLANEDDSLSYSIADTNVVRFDTYNHRLYTKDTGSTLIIFRYKGFRDTAYIYITLPSSEVAIEKKCPGQTITYSTDTISGATFRWQVDRGTGYSDLVNDTIYSGTTTNTLTINNIPTTNRNNKYRCVITKGILTSYSNPSILQFGVLWKGAVDTSWHNPANWSCGRLPDENTDVIIGNRLNNQPVISLDAACYSITMTPATNVKINSGAKLTVKGQQRQ